MLKIAVTLVLYNTDKQELNNVISACVNSTVLVDIYLIDNSPNDNLSYLDSDKRVNYFKSEHNGGFGYGHNTIIRRFKLLDSYDYCLVINPDIEFNFEVIEKISKYMEQNTGVGVLMPKILNHDGSLQFARRLLPSPFDIIRKKILPHFLHPKKYEMIDYEPNKPIKIVGLCGCFMFLRIDALKVVGLFDERYFMYFEDTDLCDRVVTSGHEIIETSDSFCTHYKAISSSNSLRYAYRTMTAFKFSELYYFSKYERKYVLRIYLHLFDYLFCVPYLFSNHIVQVLFSI